LDKLEIRKQVFHALQRQLTLTEHEKEILFNTEVLEDDAQGDDSNEDE